MALFLAHTAFLLGGSYASARRLFPASLDRILATALLAWANLIATCLLLSGVHRLGDPAWFLRTSLLLALFTWLALLRVTPSPDLPAPDATKPGPLLLAGFLATLGPIAYASLRIAATYVPNNYDSLAYHLSRAMYYLGQGNLAHFDTGNPRQIYFPFNYNLLQAFALIYSPPLTCLNFINLASWALAGAAVYRICRLSALRAPAALIATWMALTSTQILAQATATTNDLPTGAGLVLTLVFILRWRLTRRIRDALFAGLGAGLTIGSKLTVIFFAPAAGLIVLALSWSRWRHGRRQEVLAAARTWLAPALLAFVFASPFALINLSEKGEWINKTYDFTLNRPFSTGCVVQTSEAYLVQLFLEPLQRFTAYDLKFNGQLNAWGRHFFFPHWNDAYAFSELLLFPPDLNEDHVWFGFAGPAFFLCGLFCLLRVRRPPGPVTWLAGLGIGWFAAYFTLNKWSLYNHRYFVPAMLVLSPCLAAVTEAGWASPRYRRTTRAVLVTLAITAVWFAGVYLFDNTSRPYAPLWEGKPAPPALPALPAPMAARLPGQPRINIYSTDGNERIFLLMAQGRHQRFTSFKQTQPDAYNVYSEWGFPRKVAYSNIEQQSSYTIVPVSGKRTAGVEFLGTIGSGGDALDYYGLMPHPGQLPANEENHNLLVTLSYAPHNPNRYLFMRTRVVGLNPADHARLILGVDYDDGTSATLATFTASGETPTPVTKTFRRFTVRVDDQATGRELGTINIPYLFRDQPPDVEAPSDPDSLFSAELIAVSPKTNITSEGLAPPEGPYPQWDLPVIRWAKAPVMRLEIPAAKDLARIGLTFSLRLQARDSATVDVVFNGVLVKSYACSDRTAWLNDTLNLTPLPGKNVLEFRNVTVGTEPDWIDYLDRYPDVKNYLLSQHLPLEKGAKEHYEEFGVREHRVLNLKRELETLPASRPYYFLFSSLRLDGYRTP